MGTTDGNSSQPNDHFGKYTLLTGICLLGIIVIIWFCWIHSRHPSSKSSTVLSASTADLPRINIDSRVPTTVSVKVRDDDGSPASARNVTASLDSASPLSLVSTNATTDVKGVAQFTIKQCANDAASILTVTPASEPGQAAHSTAALLLISGKALPGRLDVGLFLTTLGTLIVIMTLLSTVAEKIADVAKPMMVLFLDSRLSLDTVVTRYGNLLGIGSTNTTPITTDVAAAALALTGSPLTDLYGDAVKGDTMDAATKAVDAAQAAVAAQADSVVKANAAAQAAKAPAQPDEAVVKSATAAAAAAAKSASDEVATAKTAAQAAKEAVAAIQKDALPVGQQFASYFQVGRSVDRRDMIWTVLARLFASLAAWALACIFQLNVFDILQPIVAPQYQLDPVHRAGCMLTGFGAGAGAAFWHDMLDAATAAKSKMASTTPAKP